MQRRLPYFFFADLEGFGALAVLRNVEIKPQEMHTLWAGESGSAEYAGWREKDGKPLLLLKSDESAIIVLPADTETLKHVKHLTIGDTVTFESDGTVQRKGLRL